MSTQQATIKEYYKIPELSDYTGISKRTLYDLIKSPVNPIPHYRIGSSGRILRVKKSEFDDWMRSQKASRSSLIDDIVKDISI